MTLSPFQMTPSQSNIKQSVLSKSFDGCSNFSGARSELKSFEFGFIVEDNPNRELKERALANMIENIDTRKQIVIINSTLLNLICNCFIGKASYIQYFEFRVV